MTHADAAGNTETSVGHGSDRLVSETVAGSNATDYCRCGLHRRTSTISIKVAGSIERATYHDQVAFDRQYRASAGSLQVTSVRHGAVGTLVLDIHVSEKSESDTPVPKLLVRVEGHLAS